MENRFSYVTFSKRRCRVIHKICRAYEKLGLISEYQRTTCKLGKGKQYNFIYVATEEISDYLRTEIFRSNYA